MDVNEFIKNNKLLIDLFGLIGAFLSLLPYVLLQTDKVEEDGFLYNFLNIISSFILIIYSIVLSAWSNILVSIVIVIFASKRLINLFLRKQS